MATNDNNVTVLSPKAKGFNYGTGWAPRPFPPMFHAANVVADGLREIAHVYEQWSWKFDMAIRDMRHSDTYDEFQKAMMVLDDLMREFEKGTKL